MAVKDKRQKAQWQAAGVVEAPVSEVWALLPESIPSLGPAVRRLTSGDERDIQAFELATPREGRVHVEIDRRAHRIAVQGEWWYRGVYSVEPHERGSLVVYRVYNVALGASWWAARLVQGPQHAREMGRHLAKTLAAVCDRLGCSFHLLKG